MADNIFKKEINDLFLENYVHIDSTGRENLGDMLPVFVYRLMQYSIKDELIKQLGKDITIEVFRKAGYKSGTFFINNMLDKNLELNEFIAQLCKKLEEYKIGVLRIEKFDKKTGSIILTISEDADCSGLPVLGETVCNYEEGFIAAVLSLYTGSEYVVREIDCWATGDRVCRFDAKINTNL